MTAPGMVVVGAGEYGARAAFTLRENGWTGPVTLVGAEPLLPYERPPLSKAGPVSDSAGPVTIRDAGRTGTRPSSWSPASR